MEVAEMRTRPLVEAVHDALAARATTVTDPVVTVGDRAVLVDCLVDGSRVGGLAHRPPGSNPSDPEPTVETLAAAAVSAPAGSVRRAVGLATLNALSAPEMAWRVGDPMAALSTDIETIATVGLFRPAFRKFGDVTVRVVERDPGTVDESSLPSTVPTTLFAPGDASEAFDGADVCFITGSTLVYGGLNDYLAAAAAVPVVVLIGATASFLPTPLFDRGVDLLAGARVTDVEQARRHVAAGDCGTDLHDHGVEKVYCPATRTLPGIQLPTEPTDTQS